MIVKFFQYIYNCFTISQITVFLTFELSMNEIELFYILKEKVLLKYKEHYPFFDGNWKTFSTEDIRNLIDDIEQKTGQTLSEKWIYTHLKPSENQKLPRKDTLNIVSEYVGFSSWDEFKFLSESQKSNAERPKPNFKHKTLNFKPIITAVLLIGVLIYFLMNKKPEKQTMEIKDEYTLESIPTENINIFEVVEDKKIPIKVENSKIEIENKDSKIIIESPYYKTEEIKIKKDKKQDKILIKPDDYAMMLKAFMLSDIKDWETRKEQLQKILADDLEVIVMLKNDLGAEYFNKEEFTQMLVIPSDNLKKMKIIQLENDENNKIKFVRIISSPTPPKEGLNTKLKNEH